MTAVGGGKNNISYSFFQLLQNLEENNQLKNIQLKPSSKLGFPATDILSYENNIIELSWMGLYGVDSPLPHYFLVESDQLQAFLDIFNHRLYALFYLALKKYNTQHYFYYISERRIKTRVGLIALLKNRGVKVHEFIPEWINILPDKNFILGENSLLGNQLLSLNSRLHIEIGPMSFAEFLQQHNNIQILKAKIYFLVIDEGTDLYLGWTFKLGELDHVVKIQWAQTQRGFD